MFKINLRGQTFLYNLLVNSKLRVWRHVLFVMALTAISFNQTYVIFQQDVTELGTDLYWITLCNLASYLVVAYLNIYLLIPRYLMRKRYLLYTIVLFVIVFVLMCLLTIRSEEHTSELQSHSGCILFSQSGIYPELRVFFCHDCFVPAWRSDHDCVKTLDDR